MFQVDLSKFFPVSSISCFFHFKCLSTDFFQVSSRLLKLLQSGHDMTEGYKGIVEEFFKFPYLWLLAFGLDARVLGALGHGLHTFSKLTHTIH
jgi:hypothetical protein